MASSAPLDQYIVEHPDFFFGRSPEHAYINPENLEILMAHLKCAAFELPLRDGEKFGQHEIGDLVTKPRCTVGALDRGRDVVAGAFEDHDTTTDAEFARREAHGDFALTWRAHGLAYGVPLAALSAVESGVIAVCNLSRGALSDARRRFPRVFRKPRPQ